MMKIKNKLKSSLKGLIGAMVLSVLFLGSPLSSIAGSPVETSTEEGWTLIAEKGNVKAYAQIVRCGANEQSMYLVKLVNNNKNENLLVEYSINVLNDPTSGPTTRSVELRPNSSVQGNCEIQNQELLQISAPLMDEASISELQFTILTAKAANNEK